MSILDFLTLGESCLRHVFSVAFQRVPSETESQLPTVVTLSLDTHHVGFLAFGNGTPLQYSGLENSINEGAWKAAVHGVAKSRTRLSDFTFTFHFHALEKAMASHSSVLAWRIPGTGEPDGLPSMGSHKVGHD